MSKIIAKDSLVFCLLIGLCLIGSTSIDAKENEDGLAQLIQDPPPLYQLHEPKWGLQLNGSWGAAGSSRINTASNAEQATHAIEFHWDYQPLFLRDYGLLAIGPYIGLNPLNGKSSELDTNPMANNVGGIELRYQMRYFKEQAFVPIIGYHIESRGYKIRGSRAKRFTAHGPSAGLWFLLNGLDKKTAAFSYLDYGISRTYIITEVKWKRAQSSELSMDGFQTHAGLRFEL